MMNLGVARMGQYDLTALILSGGGSRRMGRDKIWLPLGPAGTPLIQHVVARVRPLASELLFSANASERLAALASELCDQGIPAHVVPDLYPAAGPLAGLHAGLSAASCDLLLAVAGDMPFINPALVTHLVTLLPGFDVVLPELPHPRTGEPVKEPLHALYRRSCLSAVAAHLAAGDRQMVSFLPDVRVRTVQSDELRRIDPGLRSLFNINTPEDWRAAGQMLDEAVAGGV
jgi:molybdopterin-guanine dinucleotide biosynthesis protein A